MEDLKAIGRSNPVGTIQQWQANESALATNKTNRAVSDLNMEKTKQDMGIKQRAINEKIDKEKKLDMPKSIEMIKMQFEGGGQPGTAGAFVLDAGRKLGLIDMSQGGDGTISDRNMQKLGQWTMQPQVAAKISRMRVNTGRQQVTQLQQALAKKPDDKQLQQELQKASTFFDQSLYQDKALGEAQKEKNKQETMVKYEFGFVKRQEQKYINQGMGEAEAKMKAISDLEATKKAGKFAPKGGSSNGKISEADVQKYKKEMVSIQANIARVESRESDIDTLMKNPATAKYMGGLLGNANLRPSRDNYLKVLNARYQELSGMVGGNYGVGEEDTTEKTWKDFQ